MFWPTIFEQFIPNLVQASYPRKQEKRTFIVDDASVKFSKRRDYIYGVKSVDVRYNEVSGTNTSRMV